MREGCGGQRSASVVLLEEMRSAYRLAGMCCTGVDWECENATGGRVGAYRPK